MEQSARNTKAIDEGTQDRNWSDPLKLAPAPDLSFEVGAPGRSKRRELIELAVALGLILLVIWTPRPWQKLLWWVAATGIAGMISNSLESISVLRPRATSFFRALWVPGVALVLSAAAIGVAIRLHTLRTLHSPLEIVKLYGLYALWAFVQQFLLQGFFFLRLRRVLPSDGAAALAAASIFALTHLPNPILAPITFLWGLAACRLFLRYGNIYSLGLAHAILGVTIAITVPGPVDHNMRVGYGYLIYKHGATEAVPFRDRLTR
jgi:hypothetical protein